MKNKSSNYIEPGFYPVQIGLNGITGQYFCPTCWVEIDEKKQKCPRCKQPLINRTNKKTIK